MRSLPVHVWHKEGSVWHYKQIWPSVLIEIMTHLITRVHTNSDAPYFQCMTHRTMSFITSAWQKEWCLTPVPSTKNAKSRHYSQHTNAVSHHQCPTHRARGRVAVSCSQCQSLRTKDRGASSMGPSSHTTVITVAARVRLVGPTSSITETRAQILRELITPRCQLQQSYSPLQLNILHRLLESNEF